MGKLNDPPFTLSEIFDMLAQVNECECPSCVTQRRFLATIQLFTSPDPEKSALLQGVQAARVDELIKKWLAASANVVSEEGDLQVHWRGPDHLRRGMLQLLRGEEFDFSIPLSDEERRFLGMPPGPS
jgi:hypothetical protein